MAATATAMEDIFMPLSESLHLLGVARKKLNIKAQKGNMVVSRILLHANLLARFHVHILQTTRLASQPQQLAAGHYAPSNPRSWTYDTHFKELNGTCDNGLMKQPSISAPAYNPEHLPLTNQKPPRYSIAVYDILDNPQIISPKNCGAPPSYSLTQTLKSFFVR